MLETAEAAKYILVKNPKGLEKLNVHKILYICNCYHIWIYDAEMLKESFFAYSFGPLLKAFYEKTKNFKLSKNGKVLYCRNFTVDSFPDVSLDSIPEQCLKVMDFVCSKYKQKWSIDNFISIKCKAYEDSRKIKPNNKIEKEMVIKYKPFLVKPVGFCL